MTTRSGFTSAAREVVDIVAHFAFYILRHMTALFFFWRRDIGICFAQESHGDNDEPLHSMVVDKFPTKASHDDGGLRDGIFYLAAQCNIAITFRDVTGISRHCLCQLVVTFLTA